MADNGSSAPKQARGFQVASNISSQTQYGWFYFFVRRSGAGGLGHMGWGFQFNGLRTSSNPAEASGSYTMGSLENISGWAVRTGDGDVSAAYWWAQRSEGPQSMYREMSVLEVGERQFVPKIRVQDGYESYYNPHTQTIEYTARYIDLNPDDLTYAQLQAAQARGDLNWAEGGNDPRLHIKAYDEWKAFYVSNPKPNDALREARRWEGTSWVGTSYSVLWQNCLDNAVKVGLAYGVPGLPWRITNPGPNAYFNNLTNYHAYGRV